MKISTRGRYGLRALVDLVSRGEEGAVSLVHVAERQKISLNYLEQVFATLRKEGIVKSQKGAAGGYQLARSPEKIRVGEVISALEGDFHIINQKKGTEDCVQEAIQTLVWDRIDELVNTYLDGMTLAQLTESYKHRKI